MSFLAKYFGQKAKMGYERIQECNAAEVLRHFVRLEASRSKYADKREEMINWISLPDIAFIQQVHNFAQVRDDENPTIVWTIGSETNKHYLKVRRWFLAKINLECLYTCGISCKMRQDLDSVNGNLKKFVKEGYAKKYGEFHMNFIPSDTETRRVIGIAHLKPDRDGKIEIVDGVHRAVAMLANEISLSQAYIAELS